ncbi:hypothetical protein TrRE_jg2354 [Triparma retinervis]|uniref:Rap-GAP domain-containing protein n=1 Tax=Triparma retinervis TaxID=2557542 RepID=A0A9W7ECI7_9STRA|nr:hypothetical protein TrRE_jg2354 [Triparma retinervis]
MDKMRPNLADFKSVQDQKGSQRGAPSLDDSAVVALKGDKRLLRFFTSSASPRKRLRTALEFTKVAAEEEREIFFVGFKDDVFNTVVETVEQYEKMKLDEWNEEAQHKGLFSKLGLKKKIVVNDWKDVFHVLSHLMSYCSEQIAFGGWKNEGMVSLMTKLLHPGNMHSIRVPALDLLLELTGTISDHSDFDSHITLLQSTILLGFESLVEENDEDVMVFKTSGDHTPKKIRPTSSALLKNLHFSAWGDEPSECLAAEMPLSVNDHLEMLERLLNFASKMGVVDGEGRLRRSDSIGGKQDENLGFAFWNQILAHSVLSAFFPVASLLAGGGEPPKFSNERAECPVCVHLVLERWLNELVESGGAALDIIWSGDLGGIIEDSLSERFAFRSTGDEHSVRLGLAFRTVQFYNKLGSGSWNTPKPLAKNMASTCVLFASHVSKLLLDMGKHQDHEEYHSVMEGILRLFEAPLEKGLLRSDGAAERRMDFQRLLLNVLTSVRARADQLGLEYTTRLIRALFKTATRGSDGGAMEKVREWVVNDIEGGGGMPKVIVMEWRELLLCLTKMLIYHLALGEGSGRSVEAAKKNSRWLTGAGNWLKCSCTAECFKILNRHLHMIGPELMNLLDCRLHTLTSRAIADAVRIWVNEAIVPERHYKAPPKRGGGLEQRNMSKERAKKEEFDLASPLVRIGPGTIMKVVGAWLFAAADCKGKGFREGRSIALESLMRIMVVRTFGNLGEELEGEILVRVKEAFEVESSGTLVVILRMMGDVFLSEVPGVSSLVEDYIAVIEGLLADKSGGNVLLGAQTKMSVMNSLCCITTLINKFGDIEGRGGKPLKDLKLRVGDIYIKFASNQNEEDHEWLRLCATGLFLLMVNVLSDMKEGEEENVRHWILTLCEWCNSPNDNMAFASLDCLLNLSALLSAASVEFFYSSLMTNLCGSTWQMLRTVYSKAQEALAKIQGKGFIEVAVDKVLKKSQSARIVKAIECIEAWIMLNPSLFLKDLTVCYKFFDVLEAGVMGKFDTGKGADGEWDDGSNRMPRMLMQLKMDMNDMQEKGREIIIPVFTDISDAAEDALTHVLNLVSFGGSGRSADLVDITKHEFEEEEEKGGEEGRTVWISILDQVLVSVCPRKTESVVVVRDASGGYAWRSEVNALGVGEAGEKIVKQVVRRRCLNLAYNKQLYDQAGEHGGDLSIHKGPAWYSKGSNSSFFVGSGSNMSIMGSMIGRGTSPSSCYVCLNDGRGDGDEDDYDMLDGVEEEGQGRAPGLGELGKTASGAVIPGPPPMKRDSSVPPPPPPLPRPLSNSSSESKSPNSAQQFSRKDMLLARVASSRKGEKFTNGFTNGMGIISDYDLSTDNLKELVDNLFSKYGGDLDDPTMLGGDWAKERGFQGDVVGGVGRIRLKDAVERIIKDRTMSALFVKFLKKEYAMESWNFLKEVEGWVEGWDGADEKKAEEIWERFVKEGGEEQVNLPQKMVQKVKERMEGGVKGYGKDMFDGCVEEIVEMLARDKITRFLDSPECKERKEVFELCVRMEAKGGGEEGWNLSRLFASQIGLICPYDCEVLKVMHASGDKRSTFMRKLKFLDARRGRENVKIGVLYCGKGQTSQRGILANKGGSDVYERFIDALGEDVDLKYHKGFNGKLDVKYFSNGRKMKYYATDKVEVAFHVATRMPTVVHDNQQVKKKQHVGNDHVTIVWSEHPRDYLPCTVTSEFNDVVIALHPLKRGGRDGLVRVRITVKEGVKWFGPLSDGMLIRVEDAPALVRQTAVNANRVIRGEIEEGNFSSNSQRRNLIKEICDTYGEPYEGAEVWEMLCREGRGGGAEGKTI